MNKEKLEKELTSRIDIFDEKDLQEFDEKDILKIREKHFRNLNTIFLDDNSISKNRISNFDILNYNAELFRLNCNKSDLCRYYLIIFSKPKYKILNLTLSGNIKFRDLSEKLFSDIKSNTFFNVRNIILYDTSNNNLRSFIIKMFSTRSIIFQDWNIEIERLIEDSKLDIIYFTSRQFYQLKIKNILYTKDGITNYYKFTNIEEKKIKCDLCQSRNYAYILEKDFVLNEQFNKFCKTCAELIHKLPTTKITL